MPNHAHAALLVLLALPLTGNAAGDLTQQEPVTLRVRLGGSNGALSFEPAQLQLETGRLYKLVLENTSDQEHYFTSEQFAASVYTRKVEVAAAAGGTLAEVKGSVREIEVLPGGVAEWWLVPIKSGSFSDLRCTVPGHAQAGMVGRIEVR